jgi:hypothetical protein
MISHLEQGARKSLHPSQGAEELLLVSGGLRYAATTGYYLTALQAEKSNLLRPVHLNPWSRLYETCCPLPTALLRSASPLLFFPEHDVF